MSYVLNPGSGSATIGGTIEEDQIAYGSATDTIAGSDNLKYDPSAKKVTIKTDGVTDTLVLESTDAGSADHAPDLKLYRNSASPATNDKLGEIRFAGNKSDGTEYSVTKITAEMNTLDSSDRLSIDVASSGGAGQQNYEYMRIDGGIRDVVFNETGVDIDFRIEGQNNQDLFVTDASQDAVAIGVPLASMSSTLFQVGGPMSITSANSVSNLDIKFSADTNTGVFSPGADQISFAVGGADALGVGANKNVTVGGSSGTAGQVLTSGGSGGATTWTTVSGGSGEKTKNIGYLTSPIDDKSGGTDVSVYSLTMATNGTSTTTSATGGYATTFMTLVPFIVPIVPTTSSMQFSFRTGTTAGSEWGVGWYASDSDGMPNGSPFYSNVFTPTAFTTYTLNTGELLSKGDLIWFAYFGQTTGTTLTVASASTGMYNLLPELRSSLSYLANRATVLTTTASAATTFDSLSQSTVYDTAFVSSMIRIAMTF